MELLTYHSLLISKTRQQFPGCNHIPKQLQHRTENQIPVTQTASKKNPTFIFLHNFMLPRFLTSTGSITSVTAHQVRSITSELQLRSDEGYFGQTLLTGACWSLEHFLKPMIQEPLRNFSGGCLLSLIPFNHIAKLNATVAAPCGTCPAVHATQQLGNYLLHHTYLPAQPRLMWQHPCQLIETTLITRNNSNNSNKPQRTTSIKGTPIKTINQQKINNGKK